MTALGLLLLVITLPAANGAHSAYSLAGMIAFEGAMLVIGALLIGGKHLGMPDHHHGVMLGAAAGVLFGVSDIAIKALTGLGGVGGILASPWLAITLLASVVAFYASARGLQEGEAVPVIAATSTAANVSCILGGIIVFGDPMPSDAVGHRRPGLRLRARRRRRAGHPAAGPRRRAPPTPHGVAQQLSQQRPQLAVARFADRPRQVLVRGQQHGGRAFQHVAALRRDVQRVQAPVGGVAPALDEPARLERVDELDHDRRARPAGGRRARAGTDVPSASRVERAEVADLDAERAQHRVGALVEAVVGAREQEPGAVGQRGRRRLDQRAQQRVEPRVLGG